ncbi:ATPase PAAT isoform X2 [Lithobates pipiens]
MSSVQSARGPVLCSSSWLCHGDLSSVLHVTGPDQTATTTPGITSREECVILELPCPTGDAIPCTLTISSAAQGTHHILEVSLCSEARTIEVYSLSEDGQEEEEYLGTSRGEKCSFRSCGDDEPFTLYRAYLKFDFPVPACKVKNQAPFGSHLLQLFGSFQPQAYRSKKDPKEETPQLAQATPPDTRLEAAESHPSVPPPPPTDLKSAMSSFLQNQLGQSVSPESILPLLQNLTVQRNIDRDSGGKSCSMPREKELEPSLEKVLSAHMERLERNLMKHVDERMRCLQEHLDTRIDQLFVCLLERGGKSNPHPATAGDKLVNGHMDYQDSDCNILSVQ